MNGTNSAGWTKRGGRAFALQQACFPRSNDLREAFGIAPLLGGQTGACCEKTLSRRSLTLLG